MSSEPYCLDALTLFSELYYVRPFHCSLSVTYSVAHINSTMEHTWTCHTHVHMHTTLCTDIHACTYMHIDSRLTVLIVSQENSSTLRVWNELLEFIKVSLTIVKATFSSVEM